MSSEVGSTVHDSGWSFWYCRSFSVFSKSLGRDSIRLFFPGEDVGTFHRRHFWEKGFPLREKGLPHYVTCATHFLGEYATSDADGGERNNAENCTKNYYKSNYLNYFKRDLTMRFENSKEPFAFGRTFSYRKSSSSQCQCFNCIIILIKLEKMPLLVESSLELVCALFRGSGFA